jgi:3-methyladenine DNA glycosylase AlkD
MQLQETMQELERLGTEQNRKIYSRHGVGENFYGVSFANLEAMRKRIKQDHNLALQLWATGNHDARMLATKIADPTRMDLDTINAWLLDLDNYIIADSFADLVVKTPYTRRLAESWVDSENEWTGRAGWHLIALLALHDASLPDSYFEPYLMTIAREIHTRKNRTREGMNSAMIAIGTRNAALQAKAIETAQRVGKVQVDHGDTSCKTPDAIPYILKARARAEARAA